MVSRSRLSKNGSGTTTVSRLKKSKGNWTIISSGNDQIHWFNSKPEWRGLSPVNVILNKERDGKWGIHISRGESEYFITEKSRVKALNFVKLYMKNHPDGE